MRSLSWHRVRGPLRLEPCSYQQLQALCALPAPSLHAPSTMAFRGPPRRAITCKMCGQQFFPASMKFHVKACKKKQAAMPVPCPYCDVEYPRSEFEHHTKHCRHRPADAHAHSRGRHTANTSHSAARYVCVCVCVMISIVYVTVLCRDVPVWCNGAAWATWCCLPLLALTALCCAHPPVFCLPPPPPSQRTTHHAAGDWDRWSHALFYLWAQVQRGPPGQAPGHLPQNNRQEQEARRVQRRHPAGG